MTWIGKVGKWLLLQRLTAVQVRPSGRLMPQNQLSGRGLPPSPTAWLPDQHPAAILADISWYILGRAEGRGLKFGQLVRTLTKGSVWNANPLQMGTQTTVPCAQAEDGGLLGLLQSPNWVELWLVSTVFFLPASIVPRVGELTDKGKRGTTSECPTLEIHILLLGHFGNLWWHDLEITGSGYGSGICSWPCFVLSYHLVCRMDITVKQKTLVWLCLFVNPKSDPLERPVDLTLQPSTSLCHKDPVAIFCFNGAFV